VVEIKRKIVEGKEGEKGGRWPADHTWPPLDSHFHSSPHLAPLMLTPLTKSIKRIIYMSYHHYSLMPSGGLWATEEGTCDTSEFEATWTQI
jgi:hypothetical protein